MNKIVGIHSYANFEIAYREHMDEYNIPFSERDIQSAWELFLSEPEAFCFLNLQEIQNV